MFALHALSPSNVMVAKKFVAIVHCVENVYVFCRESPMEGSPFIDDYIVHSEQVTSFVHLSLLMNTF